MNPHQRQQLEARLKALPKPEQDRIFTAARAKRADDQKRRKSERRKFEDLDDPRPGSSKRSSGDPVRLVALKILARELAEGMHAGDPTSRDREGAEHTPGDASETPPSRSGLVQDALVGVAVEVGKRRCVVRPVTDGVLAHDETTDVPCRLPADLAGRQQTELCVGDRVAYEVPEDDRREQPSITHVLQRKTVLARRDPATRQRQAIAANVDAVVVVVSVVSPPLHPRLIDRYLLAIEDSWVERAGRHADDPDPAQAIIAVNKLDLLERAPESERAEELAKLEPYKHLGVPIVMCCASDGRGMDELRGLLAGKTVAFVGHSGVGKSSLTNALDERLGIRVGEVGTAANRGRHTTTSAQLHEIVPPSPPGGRRWPGEAGSDEGDERAPGASATEKTPHPGPLPEGEREESPSRGLQPARSDGPTAPPGTFWVIDTPGIRFFGLDELTPAELRDSMPEFRRLRQGCKFNDCTHTHEPGCAVKENLGKPGGVHPERYETYLRLLEEIDREGNAPQGGRIRPLADDPSPGDPP
ncbi:MAG: ribosome small subunit-dependent GTPase A [Phycisphaerales bacterium]